MEDTIISLHEVRKNYGKHQVLQNVNLDIHKGEIFGLVGRNGAGKTTIFKIILGLSDFQGGTLQVGGENCELDEGRKKIGFFVGQNFFGYMTGRQNLEYYRGVKGIKDKNEVDRVLDLVELSQAKGYFKGYSMGMRQRLGIANALLGNPEILILDEPTNGLDPQGIADIRNLVKKLNEELDMTVIISSHILGELQHTATRFGIINNGYVQKIITQEDLSVRNCTLEIAPENLDRACKVLAAADIPILGKTHMEKSLEEIFFQLIGGENRA